jgi:hypothetical protein
MPTRDGGSKARPRCGEFSPARQGDGPTKTLRPLAAGVFKSATIRATAVTLMGLEILAQDRSHSQWWVPALRAETPPDASERGAGAFRALGRFDDPPPSLHEHYTRFIATTRQSARRPGDREPRQCPPVAKWRVSRLSEGSGVPCPPNAPLCRLPAPPRRSRTAGVWRWGVVRVPHWLPIQQWRRSVDGAHVLLVPIQRLTQVFDAGVQYGGARSSQPDGIPRRGATHLRVC